MRNSLIFATLSLLALASCVVSVPDPDTDVFACSGPDDCVSGYSCNLLTSTCSKSCTGDGDCSEATPNCVNGMCGDACAATEGDCAKNGKVCMLNNGTPTCAPCNQNGYDCKNANKACVNQDGGSSTCAPTCNSQYPTCDSPTGDGSKMARCVGVKLAKLPEYVDVCAPCPASCSTGCLSASNNKADTYGAATTCSVQTCSAANPCTGANTACVAGACQTKCGSGCGSDSACVKTKAMDGSDADVCRACTSTCSSAGKACKQTTPADGSRTDWANIDVQCQTPQAAWAPPGDPSSATVPNTPSATNLAFALDASGNPIVAWSSPSLGCIKVVQWASSTWADIGCVRNDVTATATASNPALLVDSSGGIQLAWDQPDQTTSTSNVYWATHSGTTWQNNGKLTSDGHTSNAGMGISDGVGAPCVRPAIGLSSGSVPVAVWQSLETTVPTTTYGVRGRYADSSVTPPVWSELGASGSAPTPGLVTGVGPANGMSPESRPALTTGLLSSTIFVAWQGEGNTILARDLGSIGSGAWETISPLPSGSDGAAAGGVSGMVGINLNPAITVDESGYPVVAWEGSQGGKSAIFVLHADAAAWMLYGTTGQAFPPSTYNATRPSLGYFRGANGASPRPIVAFEYNGHIYVRHFSSNVWSGIESTDDSNTGISGNDVSILPKVTVYEGTTTAKVCVAWLATASGVRVLCHSIM